MADINSRLERLGRRDELERRARRQVIPDQVADVGSDFAEVVEAVAHAVRKHPGMIVMVAPGDGRQGSAVVRVAEAAGDVEVALIRSAPAGSAGPAPEPAAESAGRAGRREQPAGNWRSPEPARDADSSPARTRSDSGAAPRHGADAAAGRRYVESDVWPRSGSSTETGWRWDR